MKRRILIILPFIFIQISSISQGVGIADTIITPAINSILELRSTNKGFLPPRMTSIQRDAIISPTEGLVIYNIEEECLELYEGSTWKSLCTSTGEIDSLNCTGSILTGQFYAIEESNGIQLIVQYNGGNGGVHNGQMINSTGVIGYTATLEAGLFATGNGNLIYTISGTPDKSGTASFTLNIGNQTCVISLPVECYSLFSSTEVRDVMNPMTGRIWMDRNLGASRVAKSSTDSSAFGDLYQWGRFSDGHQCRFSDTTTVISIVDYPLHGLFILAPSSPHDWRNPQNVNFWQGQNGINNPCPIGYRLPTQAEWDEERQSWSSNDAAGAFASPLKLTMSGYRFYSNASVENVGTYGHYWSSSIDAGRSWGLRFDSSNATIPSYYRGTGVTVRCTKD